MPQDSIAPVVAFHDQVTRMSAAGLSFDLGLEADSSPSNASTIQAAIQQIEAALRLRVELGQPLAEAIAAAPEIPVRYRAALLAWLDAEEPTTILDSLTNSAENQVRVDRQIGVSLIQPFVLLLLTLAAFVLLCNTTVPRLEATYLQLWKTPSGVLSWLLVVRDTMPIWIVVVPILLALIWYWISRGSSVGHCRWLPGGKRYLQSLRYAAFADQVATLVNRGVAIEHSMMLADAELAESLKSSPTTSPPLLRWAMAGDVGNEPLPNVYRFVANSYRQSAEQRMQGLRVVLPAVLLSLVGGSLVFAFGISVFVPMIELLKDLASPGGV